VSHGFSAWLRLSTLSLCLIGSIIALQLYANQSTYVSNSVNSIDEKISQNWKPVVREVLGTGLLLPSLPATSKPVLNQPGSSMPNGNPLSRNLQLCLTVLWLGALTRRLIQIGNGRNLVPMKIWISATLAGAIVPTSLAYNLDFFVSHIPQLANSIELGFGITSISLSEVNILGGFLSWTSLIAICLIAGRSCPRLRA
jgi:hypothetical protein